MTPTDALAAAIRERLVAGRPAPLPGLGTLVRQHVSARVEERPDGSRVLLPPGETIGLTATAPDQETLAAAFARFRGVAPGNEDDAFNEAMDQLEARLAATGEARLHGVGLLRRTSGGVVLGVEADLLAAVNRTYEGLTPVPTPSAAPSPLLEETAAADEPERSGVFQDVESFNPAPAPVPDVSDAPAPEPVEDSSIVAEEPADASWSDEWDEEDELVDFVDEESAPDDEEPLSDEPEATEENEATSEDIDEDGTVDDDAPDQPEGLAVPFGGPDAEPLEDILPPTPLAVEPTLGDDDSEDEADLDDEDLDDWLSSTWTAPDADRPVSLLGNGEDQSIENADVVQDERVDADAFEAAVDEDRVSNADASNAEETVSDVSEPPSLPVFPPPIGIPPGVEIDRVGPADEEEVPALPSEPDRASTGETADATATGAFVGLEGLQTPPPSPPSIPARPAAVPADRHEQPEQSFPWWGWLLALLVLTLVGIALVVGWLRFQDSRTATPDPVNPPAEADRQPQDTEAEPVVGAPLADGEETGDARPSASRESDPTPSQAAPAGTPPARGAAVLPPRLAGLPDEDRRALSGAPIDPAAGGWTHVVFSTPLSDVARAERTRYQEAGYRTTIVESVVGGRAWYRVAVGQFDTREDALRLRDRLPPEAPPETWQLDLSTL